MTWMACPDCQIERTDYEGVGRHLTLCPNCGSGRWPIEAPDPVVCEKCRQGAHGRCENPLCECACRGALFNRSAVNAKTEPTGGH